MALRIRYAICLALVVGLLQIGATGSSAKASGTLSANDVLVLLQVGYKEAQITAQIDKAKMRGKFQLQPMQVLALRKAGASVKLLQLMGIKGAPAARPRPKQVSLAELQSWLAQKKASSWIRKQLQARGVVRREFGPFTILALSRAGLPLDLLQLVVQLKKQSTPPTTHPQARPAVRPRPQAPARTRPRLRPQPPGIPALRAPAPRRPSLRPALRRPLVRRPVPAAVALPPLDAQTKAALQTRKNRIIRRKATPIKRPKDGIYRHVGKHYELPVPQGWYIYEDVHPDKGNLLVYLTPQANPQPYSMKQGIWLSLEYLPKGNHFLRSRGLLQTGRYLMRGLLAREPGLKTKQKLKPHKWLGQTGVTASLAGKTDTNAHQLHLTYRLVRHRNALLSVAVFAGPKAHSAFAKRADALLAKLKLLPSPHAKRGVRRKTEQPVQTVIGQNTKGVVSISLGVRKKGKLTFRAAGSGFVVTSDGYVLTNWHVAVNARTKKPYEQYVLNWDQTTKQASRKATFVSAHYQWPSWRKVRQVDPKTGRISVRFQRQHVDIALLKITKPGTYPTVKLSAIRHAMLGDSVIALGFPLEGKGIQDIGNETITATTGRISRLVRMSNQRVNEIQHTAKVAGGNSGGPLFDTATGAVVGINTWVGTFDKRLRRPGMGLGYYYALPIDLGWLYFPDYLDNTRRNMSVYSWLDLGNLWRAAGQVKPAIRAYKRCIKQRPTFTPAYMKLAALFLARANKHKDDSYRTRLSQARRWADRGLKHSPYHTGLMRTLAEITMLQRSWRTAAYLLQQTIATHPKSWSLYMMRAILHHLQRDPAHALQDAKRVTQLVGKELPTGHMLRGNILYGAKRYFEGQRAYRQALQIAPKNVQALLGEARGYTLLKQHKDAVLHYAKIAATHPYEPKVFERWMMALLKSNLPKRKRKAWNIFQRLMKSTQLRDTQMGASALYFGGALAADVLNPKVRHKVMWGVWGELLAKHSKSTITGIATLRLSAIALGQRRYGLAYALRRLITPSTLRRAREKRAYLHLKKRTRRAGISRTSLFFLTFNTYPRWSPALLWRCFQLTPSLLDRKTAQLMLKKGVPAQLVMLMWRRSQQRRKAGIKPGIRKRTHRALPHNPRFAVHKRTIHRVAKLSFQSLRSGDIDTWMAIHDAKGKRQKYQKLFWTFRRGILNRRLMIYPVRRINIKFFRTPQGIYARYYFPMRINRQPTKLYYWQFRINNRRWVMF